MSASPDPAGVFFVSGGTLKATTPSYVEREADREFVEHLRAGEFCYVLTSRQMGKSSLMVRTAAQLRAAGVRTAIVDLTAIGEGGGAQDAGSAGAWYLGVARTLAREFGLSVDVGAWWAQREGLPHQQRFTEFLEDVVLGGTTGPVVILVDEIDNTLRLPFTDDFFAGIRACYNARATKPAFERLTFALLGVASPTDLIKDATRTPFNIGHRVELHDFSLAEARRTLAAGLPLPEQAAERAVERILHWTGGQPYLTQRLCLEFIRRLADAPRPPDDPTSVVDDLAGAIFLSLEASRDEVHFKYIRDRIRLDRRARRVLKAYGRILRGGRVVARPQSLAHNALKLAGLVRQTADGLLVSRNRIYDALFNVAWIRQVMPVNYWQRAAVVLGLALVGVLVLWAAWLQPMQQRSELVASLAASLRSAEEDVPRLAYARLKRVPGQAEVAEQLWADYWHRRALKLDELAGRLASLQTTNTRSFTDLEGSIVALARGLEGTQVPQVADRQATRLLAVLEKPNETNAARLSSVGSALAALARRMDATAAGDLADRAMVALASHRETNASRLAEFGVVLAAAAEPMATPDVPAMAASVTELLEKPPDQHVARLSTLGSVLARLATRMKSEPAADIASRGATVICLALESPSNTNVAELSSLADTLAKLVIQVNPPGSDLAGRGAAAMVKAIGHPSRTATTDLRQLADGFAALGKQTDARSALTLIERLVERLGRGDETDPGRLDTLMNAVLVASRRVDPPALLSVADSLVGHIESDVEPDADRLSVLVRTLTAIADLTDRNTAQRLASRGGTALIQMLEDRGELDADELLTLATMLGMLSDRAGVVEGAALAARGATVLARLMERAKGSELDDLPVLALALTRLADRSDPRTGLELARQGAALLLRAMEDLDATSPDDRLELGETLALLVNRSGPVPARDLADRGAVLLADAMQRRAGTNTTSLQACCGTLTLLSNRLSPQAAAQVAADLAEEMGSPTGGAMATLASLGSALAAVSARMPPQAADGPAERGFAALTAAIEHPGADNSADLAQLVQVLGVLAARTSAGALRSAVSQICEALEDRMESNPARLSALVSVLSSLALHADAATASNLTVRLIRSMETPVEPSALRLARIGQTLAALAGRFETDPARTLAARAAALVSERLSDPRETNMVAVLELARALESLGPRLDVRDATVLAARGAAAVMDRLDNPVSQSREVDYSELEQRLAALALRTQQEDAAEIAERTARLLLSEDTAGVRLVRLGVLLSIFADRLKPSDAGRLAQGFCTALARFEELDPARLSTWNAAVGTLAVGLDPSDAARMAEKLIRALEHPQETDRDRQANLGSALAALLPRMDARAGSRAARRAAPVLAKALTRPADEGTASAMAEVLLAIASHLDPRASASIAGVFRHQIEGALERYPPGLWELDAASLATLRRILRPEDRSSLGGSLTSALHEWRKTEPGVVPGVGLWLLDSLEPDDVAVVCEHLGRWFADMVEDQVTGDPSEALGTCFWLAYVLSRMEPTAAEALARRVTAALLGALEDPDQHDGEEIGPLGLSLPLMAAHLSHDEAARVSKSAALLCSHCLEENRVSASPLYADEEDQPLLLWSISVLSLWTEPEQAAALTARTLAATPAFPESGDADDSFVELIRGLALASLAARVPPDEAAQPTSVVVHRLTAPTGVPQAGLRERVGLLRHYLEALDPFLAPRPTQPVLRDWLHAIETLQARVPESAEALEKYAVLFRARLPEGP